MSDTMTTRDPLVRQLADELRARGAGEARIGLVLGSGLGGFAEALQGGGSVSSDEIDALPGSTVPGHAGRIVWGELAGVPLIVQQGRIHLYEGWGTDEVTRVVRAFAELGVRACVLTNSAGGLRADWPAGTLMRIRDHINFQRRAPTAAQSARGPIYDEELGRALHAAADRESLVLEQGVYVGLLGPNYETPSEVQMFAAMGGDAVGMSTVAEASVARDCGLRVCGVTCVTNPGAGISETPLNHEEVVEMANAAGVRFQQLLESAVPDMDRVLGG